jgi:hypothetical protein
MGRRRADFTEVEITRLCKGAAKAGCVVQLTIRGVTLTLRPETLASTLSRAQQAEQETTAFDEWMSKRNEG